MNQAMEKQSTAPAYRPLFSVEARCEYFGDRRCQDLAFIPIGSTELLARNRDFLLRNISAGIEMFASNNAAATTRSTPGESLEFHFKLVAQDAGFAGHSDLDGRRMDSIFAFNNDGAPKATVDVATRLHEGEWASAADLIGVNDPQLAGLLDAKDRLAPPLAVFSVRLNSGEITSATARRYYVAFKARRTRWKYYVLGPVELEPTLSIRDVDGAIEFEPTGTSPELLTGNRRAVALLSSTTIALQERSTRRFQLRANTPRGERLLVKRLAVASPHQLGKETINGQEVAVSEIYVNL
ncbi:MAG: hypothetical protein ACKVQK_28575 [Burkholderiales bacterium]